MSLLHIFIPEQGLSDVCDWVLRDAGRSNAGSSSLATIPKADEIVLIAPASRVLFTCVKLPPVGQSRMREMLAYAVEDKLLVEPENIHAVAAARGAGGETPIAIIDKAWLRQVLTQLQRAGIHSGKMLVETLLPRLETSAWSVVWNGQDGFVRTGPVEGVAVDGGDVRTPPLALKLALDEARAMGNVPARIMLYHAASADVPDGASWSESLGISVELRGAWSWQTADASFAAALNLLQGEFAPPGKSGGWGKRLRPALITLGLIAAVHSVATVTDWTLLSYEKSRLQSEMSATFKQAFPEAKAIVDPALQMRRNLSDLRRAHGATDAADFLPLLATVAPVIGQGKVHALQYQQGKLQLDLLLPGAAQADAIRGQLRNRRMHAEMAPLSPSPGGVETRLTVGIGLASP